MEGQDHDNYFFFKICSPLNCVPKYGHIVEFTKQLEIYWGMPAGGVSNSRWGLKAD